MLHESAQARPHPDAAWIERTIEIACENAGMNQARLQQLRARLGDHWMAGFERGLAARVAEQFAVPRQMLGEQRGQP